MSDYGEKWRRLDSFRNWPRAMPQKPEFLAEAGFYYTGYGDQVQCFQCDGGLKNWDSEDIPWLEHARWYNTCEYLNSNLNKSDEIIALIQRGNQQSESQAKALLADSCYVVVDQEMGVADCAPAAAVALPQKNGDIADLEKQLENIKLENDQLDKAIKKIKENRKCKTCRLSEACMVSLPCGQISVCSGCHINTKDCPLCGKKVESYQQAIFS